MNSDRAGFQGGVASGASGFPAVPRTVAVGFSLWMLFWVPVILWAYGPQNFLWLCNVAQFVLLYALWRGNGLLVASQAGTVCLVGVVWGIDLLAGLATAGEAATATAYMFDAERSLLARLTSLYHVGLPVLVIWLLLRIGYDHRGPWLQCFLGGIVVVASWLLTEDERNVNWIHRPFGVEQVWFPEPLYVAFLLAAYPLLLYLPGHWLVRGLLRFLRKR